MSAKAFAALTDERARTQQRLLIERGTHAGVSAAVVEVLKAVEDLAGTDVAVLCECTKSWAMNVTVKPPK